MGMFSELQPKYDGENRTINKLKKAMDTNPDALEKLGYEVEKKNKLARAITKPIPIVGDVVEGLYDLKKFQESEKWVYDWHRNTGQRMAYPLLSMYGEIPQLSNDMASFIKGSLYEPPRKAKRRF